MEHIEFSCPPSELSCIIGNLFVSLEPPCKYVRSTHLMLCGITHSGNSGRLTVLGDRCSFYGACQRFGGCEEWSLPRKKV